jgi:hypothetical protein
VSAWDDPALSGGLGEAIAGDLRDMVRFYEESRDRSVQTDLGPSQIGNPCTRCLARHVLGMPIERTFDDPWCRILGTAAHAWLEKAAEYSNEQAGTAMWRTEMRVRPDPELLPRGGSLDLWDVWRKTVIDHKIVGAKPLQKYRTNGPGLQYRRQAHLYGYGVAKAGGPVEHVALAFWPRGGRLSELYVWTEPYSEAVAVEALDRYRLIRDQARALGPAILPVLPADPDCWDCEGTDVTPEELAPRPNPAQTIPA